MFGGFDHLSNAAEAKSRKKREQKQQAQSSAADEDDGAEEAEDVLLNRESKSMKQASLRLAEAAKIDAEMELENFESTQVVIPDLSPEEVKNWLDRLTAGHDAGGGRKDNPISIEDYMTFFKIAHKKLRSPEARAVLRHLAMSENNLDLISESLVNMQRSCFVDCDLDVEYGCNCLGELEFCYPHDFELIERRNNFLDMCRHCFLTAIEDAMSLKQSRAQARGGLLDLQRTGTLTKGQILLFVEACSVTLQTEAVRRRLRKAYEEGCASGPADGGERAAANMCLVLQYETMEKVGFEKLFGVQQLNAAGSLFSSDQDLMMKMSNFSQLCQHVVSSASVSQVQFYMDQQRMVDAKVKEAAEEAADAQRANLQTEGLMSREQLIDFFNKNFEFFELEETQNKLKKLARTTEGVADLNRVMVEMQKAQFTQAGFSRKVGNESLANIQSQYMDDEELISLVRRFEMKCSAVWIQAVRTSKPKKLQKVGRLSRANLINYLDGIKALLSLSETRQTLREAYLSTNDTALPAELSVKMQRDLLETLGIEANFGVSCLNRVRQDYPNDREVIQKMMLFQRMAQQSVKLSTMSDEEVATAEVEETAKQEKARQQQLAMQERGRQVSQVQLAVSTMSLEDKEKIKEKMKAKWSTLMRLPQQDKMSYLGRLPDHDQIDFAMMSAIMMQEKMEGAVMASAGAPADNDSQAATPTDKNN